MTLSDERLAEIRRRQNDPRAARYAVRDLLAEVARLRGQDVVLREFSRALDAQTLLVIEAQAQVKKLREALCEARLWVDGALTEACDDDPLGGSAVAAREMLERIDDALAASPVRATPDVCPECGEATCPGEVDDEP